jgi:leucyl-tRNA synthetase
MQAPFNSTYDHLAVENAAQAHWTARDAYRVTEYAKDAQGKLKPKYYACSMLPYPSGKLHMGHVRNYTINDMMARQLRMKGFNVLMPMGWDAFGMPAENAAIANNVPPEKWTRANIAEMKAQFEPLGLSFDWTREVATCDPSYYKWNQWMFLKMLEKGIAYRKTQVVNWDPVDQTVLANEQVIDGRGWRSGALVEKREIPGYYLRITDYAEELLDHTLTKLPGWPERVRTMQENWIGKSEGVRFAFPHDIQDAAGQLVQDGKMYVFTTRADTIMGVTFVAVAPEHPLAVRAGELDVDLALRIEALKGGGTTEAELATKEKEGVATGLFVTHPLTGDKVEVWVGNYVLMSYGDGAVMGVPAHDERDFAFAKKYSLAITQVVATAGKDYDVAAWQDWYGDKSNTTSMESGQYNGLNFKACVDAVTADLIAKKLGEKKTTWRLRDWGISRQRYWGTPIPIIHCDEHGAVPVPEKDLPVVLPPHLVPDGSGNPLNKCEEFLHAACPICGKASLRETDTMDTFVDSAWYYMRYACPDATDMVDARNDYWMPMDQYIGGIEHAVLHLLYARFWTKVMRDLRVKGPGDSEAVGLVKFDEPFTNLFTQGMLLHDCYYREETSGAKRWFYPNEVVIEHDDKGRPTRTTAKEDGQPVLYGGTEKMSKSKNNVVEPREFIGRFGADTARAFVMFAGPPDQSAAWSDSGAEGAFRFLKRVWSFGSKLSAAHSATSRGNASIAASHVSAQTKKLRFDIFSVLKQVDFDYQRMQYNTVVSGAMKLLNALEDFKSDGKVDSLASDQAALSEGFGILLRVLYPVTPHICHMLWQDLGFAKLEGDLLDAPWPAVDEAALQQDEIELMLQINGKLRGSITVPAGAAKEVIEKIALGNEAFVKYAEGAAPKKVIVVPGRLVNVVV